MSNIISDFSSYLDSKYPLVRHIENARELHIARKHRELDRHLKALRSETMKYTFIDADGGVKTCADARLEELQREIQTEAERIQVLEGMAAQIDAILERHGVDSIHDLQALRARHSETLRGAPFEAWRLFNQAHGVGETRAGMNRAMWLPTEIAKLPEYMEQEAILRQKIEDAKAALQPINEDMQRLSALAAEAESL